MKVTRKKLYKEVWQTPSTILAKKYGISDRGLGKICTRHKIPKPGMGYWQKIKAGQEIVIPPLPECDEGIPSKIEIKQYNPQIRLAKQKDSTPTLEVVVPNRISKLHQLTRETKQYLAKRDKPNYWKTHNEGELYLDINVTKPLRPRALRVMDTIIKTLEARGHQVKLLNKHERLTVVEINNEQIPFAIFEKSIKITAESDEWTPVEFRRTGKLSLLCKTYAPNFRKCWNDGKRQVIENFIGDFILNLEDIAIYEAERTKEREEWHRKWEIQKKKEKKRRRKLKN